MCLFKGSPMKDYHSKLYSADYVRERVKHIPIAEKLANTLHGPKCFSLKDKEREAWSKAWNTCFLEEVERRYRGKA